MVEKFRAENVHEKNYRVNQQPTKRALELSFDEDIHITQPKVRVDERARAAKRTIGKLSVTSSHNTPRYTCTPPSRSTSPSRTVSSSPKKFAADSGDVKDEPELDFDLFDDLDPPSLTICYEERIESNNDDPSDAGGHAIGETQTAPVRKRASMSALITASIPAPDQQKSRQNAPSRDEAAPDTDAIGIKPSVLRPIATVSTLRKPEQGFVCIGSKGVSSYAGRGRSVSTDEPVPVHEEGSEKHLQEEAEKYLKTTVDSLRRRILASEVQMKLLTSPPLVETVLPRFVESAMSMFHANHEHLLLHHHGHSRRLPEAAAEKLEFTRSYLTERNIFLDQALQLFLYQQMSGHSQQQRAQAPATEVGTCVDPAVKLCDGSISDPEPRKSTVSNITHVGGFYNVL
jgi:hypothetical protein